MRCKDCNKSFKKSKTHPVGYLNVKCSNKSIKIFPVHDFDPRLCEKCNKEEQNKIMGLCKIPKPCHKCRKKTIGYNKTIYPSGRIVDRHICEECALKMIQRKNCFKKNVKIVNFPRKKK